jgi:hypothetical protein
MDRENAIRLLEALMAAGKHSAPMAKAWIKKRAWEIGLEGQELSVRLHMLAMKAGSPMARGRAGFRSPARVRPQCAISCAERSDDNSGYPPTARAAKRTSGLRRVAAGIQFLTELTDPVARRPQAEARYLT